MKATPLAKSYYRTLELSCDASAEEIREAYYRLAFTHHPDRNPGDAYAAARFKKIQIAYEWLSQRRSLPPTTAEQFPFLTPERSETGLDWQWVATLAAVAVVAVILTILPRAKPRMEAAVKTESPRLKQLPGPSHFKTKLPQRVKIPDEEFTFEPVSLIATSPPDNNPLLRSAAGRVKNLLESVEWSSPAFFVAALDAAADAVSSRFFSPESLTEAWHASATWQETMQHGLPLDPMPVTRTASDSATRWTPEENDQQVLFEDGMIRFGNRSRELASLGEAPPEWLPLPPSQDFDSVEVVPTQQTGERQSSITPSLPGPMLSAPQPAARQLEPGNDIPDKWKGERQALLLQQPQLGQLSDGTPRREQQSPFVQQPQPIKPTLPWSYDSGNSGDTLQLPRRNGYSLGPEVLSNTTFPSYRGQPNSALLNPPERQSSAVNSDAWKSSPLLLDQPGGSPPRQAEKLFGHWHLYETQQERQSMDRAQSTAIFSTDGKITSWQEWQSIDRARPTATAEASTWGTNSRQKAWPQSGIVAGNPWNIGGSFTQNRIRGVEEDFSLKGRGGTMTNLGWNSQQTSARNSNYTGLPTRPEVRRENNYFSPASTPHGFPTPFGD